MWCTCTFVSVLVGEDLSAVSPFSPPRPDTVLHTEYFSHIYLLLPSWCYQLLPSFFSSPLVSSSHLCSFSYMEEFSEIRTHGCLGSSISLVACVTATCLWFFSVERWLWHGLFISGVWAAEQFCIKYTHAPTCMFPQCTLFFHYLLNQVQVRGKEWRISSHSWRCKAKLIISKCTGKDSL